MRDASRAYRDCLAYLRLARSKNLDTGDFARRATQRSLFAGILVLGIIGLISPGAFGRLGAEPLRSGWPSWLLGAVVAVCAGVCLIRRNEILYLFERLRDPFRRPMTENPNYEGLVDAFDVLPASLQSRFTWSYVWGPMVAAVLATFFAFSAAYFVVDAILARFLIGWQQPILALVNLFLSYLVWRLAASRLATWRLATSAYTAVTTGFER
jgi:hypothetical protein